MTLEYLDPSKRARVRARSRPIHVGAPIQVGVTAHTSRDHETLTTMGVPTRSSGPAPQRPSTRSRGITKSSGSSGTRPSASQLTHDAFRDLVTDMPAGIARAFEFGRRTHMYLQILDTVARTPSQTCAQVVDAEEARLGPCGPETPTDFTRFVDQIVARVRCVPNEDRAFVILKQYNNTAQRTNAFGNNRIFFCPDYLNELLDLVALDPAGHARGKKFWALSESVSHSDLSYPDQEVLHRIFVALPDVFPWGPRDPATGRYAKALLPSKPAAATANALENEDQTFTLIPGAVSSGFFNAAKGHGEVEYLSAAGDNTGLGGLIVHAMGEVVVRLGGFALWLKADQPVDTYYTYAHKMITPKYCFMLLVSHVLTKHKQAFQPMFAMADPIGATANDRAQWGKWTWADPAQASKGTADYSQPALDDLLTAPSTTARRKAALAEINTKWALMCSVLGDCLPQPPQGTLAVVEEQWDYFTPGDIPHVIHLKNGTPRVDWNARRFFKIVGAASSDFTLEVVRAIVLGKPIPAFPNTKQPEATAALAGSTLSLVQGRCFVAIHSPGAMLLPKYKEVEPRAAGNLMLSTDQSDVLMYHPSDPDPFFRNYTPAVSRDAIGRSQFRRNVVGWCYYDSLPKPPKAPRSLNVNTPSNQRALPVVDLRLRTKIVPVSLAFQDETEIVFLLHRKARDANCEALVAVFWSAVRWLNSYAPTVRRLVLDRTQAYMPKDAAAVFQDLQSRLGFVAESADRIAFTMPTQPMPMQAQYE